VAVGGRGGGERVSAGTGAAGDEARSLVPPDPDPLGKMALYSGEGRAPAYGTFLVECSSCKRETPLTALQLVRAALPLSVHLPLLRRYSSFMRCPACGRRAWLRVIWKV